MYKALELAKQRLTQYDCVKQHLYIYIAHNALVATKTE